MKKIEITTYVKCSMLDITKKVKDEIKNNNVIDGQVIVYCPHTTAGITINENADPDVCKDMLDGLEEMVPKLQYVHFEGNSRAHIKATMVGASVSIPIIDGEMLLGRWQGIYFCEFDGPRARKFIVDIIKK